MSRSKTVFLFSGMGSQYYQMGRELFEQFATFARWMRHYDARVVAVQGESVLAEIYAPGRPRGGELSHLKRGAAALLTVECALARALIDQGLTPDVLLGASLGETAAGIVAGALDFDEMLTVFGRHTDAIGALCEPASLLGILQSADWLAAEPFLRARCEVAAFNFEGYVVVTVRDQDQAEVLRHLHAQGVVSQRIAVAQGFHSSILDPAEALCRQALAGVQRSAPSVPVLSCATGRPVTSFDEDHFWAVLRQPIRFQQTLSALESAGPATYVDVGTSGTLATYTRHLLSVEAAPRVFPILTPFGRDVRNLEKLTSAVQARQPRRSESMKAVLFPGQGAQQKGMGGQLFDAFPAQTEAASAILGYNVRALCLDDPRRELGKTQFTQPALFVVGALSYLDWLERSGRAPDLAAGHSLGEYNALFAAGVFDFETGVRLVKRRGELMAAANGGAMAAVVGLDEARIRALLAERGLLGVDVANINTPRQIVLSGPPQELDRAGPIFEAAGARVVRLAVSAAFHSRYMESAAREFASFLATVPLCAPRFPVIANVSARPYGPGAVGNTMAAQLRSPVRWCESIQHMLSLGDVEWEELGAGKVLTRMMGDIPRLPPPEQPVTVLPTPRTELALTPGSTLGSAEFRRDYGVAYAYYAGPMAEGVSGVDLVARLAGAGILGVFGASGLPDSQVEQALTELERRCGPERAFAVDLRAGAGEAQRVQLALRHRVSIIEASDPVQVTPALVHYRLKGAHRDSAGRVRVPNRLIARTSRPDVAAVFLAPPPARIVAELVASGLLQQEEAEVADGVTMASDLCVRADGAGPTEHGAALALLPTMMRLRARSSRVAAPRLGLAGGIGSPEAAAAAFLLGADFIATDSINQCTVEAATSELVKGLLEGAEVHDTIHVPHGARFELGGRSQVLKKGLLFPARANMLYELYRAHRSIDDLDPQTRSQLEQRWFGEPLEAVARRVCDGLQPEAQRAVQGNPKALMALVFRSYLDRASVFARTGEASQKTQFHIPCGPAMGAANEWLRGTPLASWRSRHVDTVAVRLMDEAAAHLAAHAHASEVIKGRKVS